MQAKAGLRDERCPATP